MNKQKLCFEHAKNIKNSELVDPDDCHLCKLEIAFDKVLDKPQFRDLRP